MICTRSRDRHCKEPYVRERHLIKEIISSIDSLKEDNIKLSDNLKQVLRDYKLLAKGMMFVRSSIFDHEEEISDKECIKYIIQQGVTKARADLIDFLPIPKKLHEGKLVA